MLLCQSTFGKGKTGGVLAHNDKVCYNYVRVHKHTCTVAGVRVLPDDC